MYGKCKIWDNQEKKWFIPQYPNSKSNYVCEILFSMAGEMFKREVKDGVESIHLILDKVGDEDRYIECPYTGVKDNNDKKAYLHDKVLTPDGRGVIVFNCGCYMIQWNPDGNGFMMDDLGLDKNGRRRTFELLGSSLED